MDRSSRCDRSSLTVLTTALMLTIQLFLNQKAYSLPEETCSWKWASTLQGKPVYSITVSREAVYAGTSEGVYVSKDGVYWLDTSLRRPTYSIITLNGDQVLAGTSDGSYLLERGGVEWIEFGLRGLHVYALAVSGNIVYAGTSGGVYKLDLEKRVWEPSSFKGQAISIAVNPINPGVVYAGTRSFLTHLGDLYYSFDGGASWRKAWFSNVTTGDPETWIVSMSIFLPLDYSVTCILVDPCRPEEVYACVNFTILTFFIPQVGGGFKFSDNYGESWRVVGPLLPSLSTAIFDLNCSSLLAGTRSGVYMLFFEKLANFRRYLGPANVSVYSLAVDPLDGTVYAGTSQGVLVLERASTRVVLQQPLKFQLNSRSVRFTGVLMGEEKGLPGKRVYVYVEGYAVGFCETDSEGSFNCAFPFNPQDETVEVLLYYPGGCETPSQTRLSYHLVNVSGIVEGVEGVGWYMQGEEARVSTPEHLLKDLFTVYKFKGWLREGELVSTSPVFSFKVLKPVNLQAVYEVKPLWETAIGAVIVAIAAVGVSVVIALLVSEAKHRKKQKG